ncbi:type VI secretion system tube protein Hcp [Spirosoma validum]|uniref:Type VI secretion system tube protein Hcp n=1 Tax=Spirosoma validum TaxID=2771355 RepID=A0A927B8H4_9BACT|nr:type VI secretion system tube protein Hcp [Spirosoma validum]MBD2757304.1 type VI secretion system tube protein Hcp [Spirosoma validum]
MKSVKLFSTLAICLIAITVRAQDIYMKFTPYGSGAVATVGLGPDQTVKDGNNTVRLNDYLQVSSAQFDEEQTLNIGSQSSGAGAGRVAFNPLTITKSVDALTPKLFQAMCSGTAYKFVEILFVKPTADGNTASVIYKVLLKLAGVKTQAVSSVADCANGCVAESVSFEYGGMIQSTYKQQSNGSFTQNPPAGWNRVRNVQDTDPSTELGTN